MLAKAPQNAEVLALKAAIYFRSGDFDRAVSTAQSTLKIEPVNVSAITVLSQVYTAQNPDLAPQIVEAGIQQ